jgi:hypothetical protein
MEIKFRHFHILRLALGISNAEAGFDLQLSRIILRAYWDLETGTRPHVRLATEVCLIEIKS